MKRAVQRRKASFCPHSKAFTLIELLAVIAIIAILAALLFPLIGKSMDRAKRTQCLSGMRQWATALNLYLGDHEGVFPAEGIDGGNLNLERPNVWFNVLAPYVGAPTLLSLAEADKAPQPPDDKSLFTCPGFNLDDLPSGLVPSDPVFSYGYNLWLDHEPGPGAFTRKGDNPGAMSGKTAFGRLLRLSQLLKPSKTAVFGETVSSTIDNMAGAHLVYRHDNGESANIAFADGHAETMSKSNLFVVAGSADEKSQNNGVIWNPEGIPNQRDF